MPPLAYGDLDYYPLNANIRTTNSNGTLVIDDMAVGLSSVNFAPQTGMATQGVIPGRLTTDIELIHTDSVTCHAGLLCMQSQRDLTASGEAYQLRLAQHGDGLNVHRLYLYKLSTGLTGGTQLATAVIGLGIRGLRLEWALNVDWGGVLLRGSYRTTLTGPFTRAIQLIDYTPYFSVSVTEGGYVDNGSTADYEIVFDNLTLEGPP